MPRRTILSVLLTALLVLLTASAASAIFLPCEDVCEYGAPGYRNCTYYGEGSCQALPNPCYISCDMYSTCMNGGFLDGEDATEDLSAEPAQTLPLAGGTEAWIEQLAGGFYGPCLLFLGPGQPEAEGMVQPALQAESVEPEATER